MGRRGGGGAPDGGGAAGGVVVDSDAVVDSDGVVVVGVAVLDSVVVVVLVVEVAGVPSPPPVSWVMPYTISAIRTRTSRTHSARPSRLRYHGEGSASGSAGSGGWYPSYGPCGCGDWYASWVGGGTFGGGGGC